MREKETAARFSPKPPFYLLRTDYCFCLLLMLIAT
jgi:hypothetical protein